MGLIVDENGCIVRRSDDGIEYVIQAATFDVKSLSAAPLTKRSAVLSYAEQLSLRAASLRSVLAEQATQVQAVAERRQGLVKCAIKNRTVFPERLPPVKVRVYVDLLRVSVEKNYDRHEKDRNDRLLDVELAYRRDERCVLMLSEFLDDVNQNPSHDGQKFLQHKRGEVVGYSARSRKRFLESMAMARGLDAPGTFCTLTLPDSAVGACGLDPLVMAQVIKRDYTILKQRIMRRSPTAFAWWRMEFKPRLSGEFVGLMVPHIHMLLFNTGFLLHVVRRWLAASWFDVVGTRDVNHLRAGTQCDVINDRRHAMAYASKYAAKQEIDSLAAGRRWGSWGPIDRAPTLTIDLRLDEWVNLRRLLAKWLVSRAKRPRYGRFAERYEPKRENIVKKWRLARRMRAQQKEMGASIFGLGAPGAPGEWGRGSTIERMIDSVLNDTNQIENGKNMYTWMAESLGAVFSG